MALNFELKLNTEKKDSDILEVILGIEGFKEITEDSSALFETDGAAGGGIRRLSKMSQNILFEETNVSANTVVWCRLDGSDEETYATGMKNILKVFMTILQHISGDALIQLNGDDIKFLRKGDQVFLNPNSFSKDESALWRLKDVPFLNYKIKEMELSGN